MASQIESSNIWYRVTLVPGSFFGLDIYLVTKLTRHDHYRVETKEVAWFPSMEGAKDYIDRMEAS